MKAGRVAVVGVDGSGKSTLVARAFGAERRVSIVRCPAYHDDPEAPLGALSAALTALSTCADALGSHELKAVAMYLQMTLFGPVERFFATTFDAPLIFERHPLIDALAYAPLYVGRMRRNLDREALEPILRDTHARSRALDCILSWHDREQERVGETASFWDLPLVLAALFAEPPSGLVAELERRFRTATPDLIVMLEVPLDVAAARLRERRAVVTELHESLDDLASLRKCYLGALATLREIRPLVTVRTISFAADTSVAEAASALRRAVIS